MPLATRSRKKPLNYAEVSSEEDEEGQKDYIPRPSNKGPTSASTQVFPPAQQKIIDDIRLKYVSGTHPSSFGGIDRVARAFPDVPRKLIDAALSGIDAYTLQRNVKSQRYYNPIFVRQRRKLMQSDLIVFNRSDYAEYNDGHWYVLVVIDSFTRFVWAMPLVNKNMHTMVKALSTMAEEMPGGFGEQLMCDQGAEYINSLVKGWLKKENIALVKTNNKAPTVERFNQTFQNMLYKWMEYYQTRRFVDALPDFIHLYNYEKHHRIIGMTPAEAEKPENERELLDNLETYYHKAVGADKRSRPIRPKYKVGDLVRVSKWKKQFAKGYYRNVQPTVYVIKKVLTHLPLPMYVLAFDQDGRQEEGKWYEHELTLVSSNHTSGLLYKSSIIKERQRRGRPKEYLVDYAYWPEKYRQWQFMDRVTDYRDEQRTRNTLKTT